LGHVPGQFDFVGRPNQLEQVQWLPDGKQISFIYHGTLYVVNARVRN
jgi:hypothetical protein